MTRVHWPGTTFFRSAPYRLRIVPAVALLTLIAACGGGGGGSSSSGAAAPMATGPLPSSESLAEQCQTPRAADTVDPLTGDLYGDTQGSLTTEKQWIRSYVNETYLWYADVASVDPTPYVVGATVPFVNPSDNSAGSEFLATNYEVVDAYFNSQRSPFFTASGKPKDQFHFTFVTTDWVALSSAGSTAGFGFTAAVLVASPPRDVRIAYTDPGTPAATATPALVRGLQFVTINNVDVANGSDVATLNEALFAPIMGKQYVFVYTDLQGAPGNRTTFTAVAGTVTSTPVQNVGTLPAPNASVGYMLFNAQIAPAEGELIAGISTLQAANGGAGITDLVLDLRYNGGGFLDIASELAFMIAGPTPTAGKAFEVERFNNKNPFGVTTAQATTGFHNVSQGFSTTAGAALPHLDLARVFVLTGPDTCSASEAVINGLRGVGIEVIQIGHTTCGKPYGFFPQDNCDTTYFAIQFQGANAAGFSGFADGFVPAGGTAGNDLPGCQVADDLTRQLGDPAEGRLAAALLYRNNSGMCPAVSVSKPNPLGLAPQHEAAMLHRSAILENKFLLRKRFGQ